MKNSLLALLILFPCLAISQKADDLVGVWITEENKSHIEISYSDQNQMFSGTIIWLKEPLENGKPKVDEKGNKILGLQILNEFVFEDDEWVDGTIYDPESGKTYYCTITLENQNKIKVRGSLDPMGWLGRTTTWIRNTSK